MEKFRDLDSDRKQLKTLLSRSFFIFTIIFLIYLIFSYQIVKLMVLDNINYVSQSDENRIITVPIYPARGLIYDSQENIITENIVSHDLVFSGSHLDRLESDLIEISELIGKNSSLWSLDWFKNKKESINLERPFFTRIWTKLKLLNFN